MLFSPLCSGSSGNASFLEAGGRRFLIDAGLNAKRMTALLDAIGVPVSTVDAIFVTHEHIDHVAGIGVLAKRHHIPVYAVAQCFSALPPLIKKQLPVTEMRVIEPDRDFYPTADVRVLPFSIPHDAAHAVGYSFFAEGAKCTVMTDIGYVDERLLSHAADSDLLLLEANHDVSMLLAGEYPYPLKKRILSRSGHLCNEDCGRALVQLASRGVKNVILGHLSDKNNTPDLARVTVESMLRAEGIETMQVAVALRDVPTGVFRIA